MDLHVERAAEGHRLVGGGEGVALVNRFLEHLRVRDFAAATRRGYAYGLLNFLRFCADRALPVAAVSAMDLFDYVDWQSAPRPGAPGRVVVALREWRGAAPATMNRRIAAVRGLFEYAVLARRGPAGPRIARLPESLDVGEVAAFVADLATARDRAMALAMLLGGLRAGEVRGLRLADIDQGLRRLRVVGKGGKDRVVPVERAFFTELATYLRTERPAGCSTPECFLVLRGSTAGAALTEAGMRRIFRTHRARAGTPRVRPHRLRHTYGTELAAAGMDLLVLRGLMGHASPETTAGYVHLSVATLAAEYTAARARMGRRVERAAGALGWS